MTDAFASRSRLKVALAWALLAVVLGTVLQIRHVSEIGSLEATLRVGAESPARGFIEADFGGSLPVTEGLGHDGYWFYLSARDPLAADEERQPVYLGYRHRRLFYPLLAGGFGLFSARMTLIGLSAVAILGFALSTAAIAVLGDQLGARRWVPLAVLMNVGLWLSIQLVTADTLAVGLSLLAVALALRDRPALASVTLALAVLTKETSLLFALGLGLWFLWIGRRRASAVVALGPAAALAAWLVVVEAQIGGAFQTNGNLGLPFSGMIDALPNLASGSESLYGWLAVLSLVLAAVGAVAAYSRMVSALAFPWIVVGVLSSAVVWANGNNAARVLAPAFTLGLLGLAIALQRRAGAADG